MLTIEEFCEGPPWFLLGALERESRRAYRSRAAMKACTLITFLCLLYKRYLKHTEVSQQEFHHRVPCANENPYV